MGKDIITGPVKITEAIPKLSSSKLNLLEDCSWSFWCRYYLKLPQKGNSGSMRGSCVHSILEFLAAPKRHAWVEEIIKHKDCYLKPSIERYVKSFVRKNLLIEEDEVLIKTMILVALNHDFFFKDLPNSKMLETELRFDWVNESPRYSITGFIDRPVLYDDNRILARDFKSSKAKYNPTYLNGATQGFMYSLALKKLHPDRKPAVEFLFLRFPKKPSQIFETSEQALGGFEYYLEEVTNFLIGFDESKAKGNFARDTDKRWLCGKDEPGKFCCEMRRPLDYWAILEDNRVIKTAPSEEEALKTLQPNQKIEKKHYHGCPKWFKQPPAPVIHKSVHPDA